MAMTNYEKAVKAVNKAIVDYVLTKGSNKPKVKLGSLQRKRGDKSRSFEHDEATIINEITKMVYYWAQNGCHVCKREAGECITKDVHIVNFDTFVELLHLIEIYSNYSERKVFDDCVKYWIPYKRCVYKGKIENRYIMIEISRDTLYIKDGIWDMYYGDVSRDYLKAFCRMVGELSDETERLAREIKED